MNMKPFPRMYIDRRAQNMNSVHSSEYCSNNN